VTGRRVHVFDRHTPAEVERVVCEVEPAPPNITRDLDTIVLKALQKDSARRYPPAEALLEDITRLQTGLPVRARPDTVGYRTWKFVRRHRVGVGGGTLLLLTLAGGLTTTIWQARVARRETARAQVVRDFVVGLFEMSYPHRGRGREVTVREMLDRGAERAETELAGQPAAQAELLHILGSIYRDLGHYPKADTLLRRSTEISRAVFGQAHFEPLNRAVTWSDVLYYRGAYAQAESVLMQVLPMMRRVRGRDHYETATILMNLGHIRSAVGDHDSAVALFREGVAISGKYWGEENLIVDRRNLGVILFRAGRLTAAESAYTAALAVLRRRSDPSDPDVLLSLHSLAVLRHAQGEYVEANRLLREVIDKRRRLYPEGHDKLAGSLYELARTMEQTGRHGEAESLYVEALGMQERILGPEHEQAIKTRASLAGLRGRSGRPLQAEGELLAARAASERLGEKHPVAADVLHELGELRGAQGRHAEADSLLRGALAIRRVRLGASHYEVGRTLATLGTLYQETGKIASAEQALRAALANYRAALPARHPLTATALTRLGELLTADGRDAEAEPLLREALATWREKLDSTDHRIAETARALGLCLAALGRSGEAEGLLLESYRRFSAVSQGAREAREMMHRLVAFYQTSGDRAEAQKFRELLQHARGRR
jgi:eukaryotic-like serine/threonine-protein kinase